MLKYPIILRPETTGYTVIIPDFPGGFTQGETILESIAMAKDAIHTLMENDYPAPTNPNHIYLKPRDLLIYVPIKIPK